MTVIYAIDFKELDERAICKVFLAEFADAQRSANNAPPLSYAPDPPRELQSAKIRGKPVGYLSYGQCCSLSDHIIVSNQILRIRSCASVLRLMTMLSLGRNTGPNPRHD